jgi:glycosyltransferase involved in cell wall biosynthesis
MNILLINHYAHALGHGTVYRPFYFAKEWIKLGHSVTIVCASFSHLCYNQTQISQDFQAENIAGIRHIRLKTPEYQGNGVGRAINIFTFVAQLFRYSHRLIKDVQPDVVIDSSVYPLTTYPAQYIAKKARAKLIFEVHDLWPLSPIELSGMSPSHPFIILMQLAENSAYRHADRVVSLLPKAKDHMQEHGMNPDKFAWIPNGIDLKEWDKNQISLPESHQLILDNLKRSGDALVGYAGEHGLANSLSTVLETAILLKDKPVNFVLVGKGLQKSALQDRTSKLGLKNVVFLDQIPKTSIPSLLSQMDALLIVWRKLPIYRFGICPNKLMDYMMAGKPIIHGISAGNDLVAENGCGISVPAEDPPALAQAIETFMASSILQREEMGIKAQAYVINHHDYRILAQKFLEVIN